MVALVVAILMTPEVPEARTIGLVMLALEMKPVRVTFAALALESPRVMVPAPKALDGPVPETVPARIVKPPVKVLAPLKAKLEVGLFWKTPATLVPITELIVVVPAPVPELVMVPALSTEAVESVVPPAALLLTVKLKAPVIPPERVMVPPAAEPMVL